MTVRGARILDFLITNDYKIIFFSPSQWIFLFSVKRLELGIILQFIALQILTLFALFFCFISFFLYGFCFLIGCLLSRTFQNHKAQRAMYIIKKITTTTTVKKLLGIAEKNLGLPTLCIGAVRKYSRVLPLQAGFSSYNFKRRWKAGRCLHSANVCKRQTNKQAIAIVKINGRLKQLPKSCGRVQKYYKL